MKTHTFPFALMNNVKLPDKFLRTRTALVSAAMLFAFGANAADLVWIGGTGNWSAAGNWSPAQVPTAADNAFITNSGTYTVTLPAGTTGTASSVIDRKSTRLNSSH